MKIAREAIYSVSLEDQGKRLDVFLSEKDKELSRNRIQYLIKNGFVFIEEQEGVISAKSIEKLGPSTFIVKDGTFTACTCKSGLCKSPAWKIKSKKMIVTIGEYAKAKGVTFYVKNVPVFYIPYFIYPVKRKRQTGFLAPQFQSGSGEGFGIKIPFFLAFASCELSILS